MLNQGSLCHQDRAKQNLDHPAIPEKPWNRGEYPHQAHKNNDRANTADTPSATPVQTSIQPSDETIWFTSR